MRDTVRCIVAFALVVSATGVPAMNRSCETKAGAAGCLQLISLQIARAAELASGGNEDAYVSLDALQGRGAELLGLLAEHEKSGAHRELATVQSSWKELTADIAKILDNKASVVGAIETGHTVDARIREISVRLDQALGDLKDGSGPAAEAVAASRMIQLTYRMQRRAQLLIHGGEDSESASTGLRRDVAYFGKSLAGLINGDADLNLKKVHDQSVRQLLVDVNESWPEVATAISKLLDFASALETTRNAAEQAQLDSETFMLRADDLMALGGK